MSEEKDLWASHDRRLSDHDNKIADTQRNYQAVEHELRQLIERINMGVSPTQQKILEKSNTIELALANLDHKIEMTVVKMNDYVKQEVTVAEVRLNQHDDWLRELRRFMWVLAGSVALIVIGAAGKFVFKDWSAGKIAIHGGEIEKSTVRR